MDQAKEALNALAAETDAPRLLLELPRYDHVGEALAAERDKVSARVKELVDLAKQALEECIEKEESLGEIGAVLRKYEGYPSETQFLRKKLKDKLYSGVRVATQRLKRAAKMTDMAELDAVLLEYQNGGEHLASALEMARRHRQNLQDSLFFRLKSALAWDAPAEIDALLEVAKKAGEEMCVTEREALGEHREALVSAAAEALKALAESTDFEAVEGAAERYTGFAEETRPGLEAVVAQVRKTSRWPRSWATFSPF